MQHSEDRRWQIRVGADGDKESFLPTVAFRFKGLVDIHLGLVYPLFKYAEEGNRAVKLYEQGFGLSTGKTSRQPCSMTGPWRLGFAPTVPTWEASNWLGVMFLEWNFIGRYSWGAAGLAYAPLDRAEKNSSSYNVCIQL